MAIPSIIGMLVMVIGAVGLSFGIGGGSYVSRLLGEKRKEDANKVLSTCTFLAFGMGILLTVIGLGFLEPILKMFGATDTVLPMASSYGRFILMGSIAQVLNMIFNNMLRSEGSAKNSMIGMTAGAVLNIVLDPIFIFGLGLGIKGAAIATTLSQFVTTGILLYQYLGKKTLLTLSYKYFKPSPEVMVLAKDFMGYFVISMILMSFTNVLGVYYQAVGRGKPALILSVARQGIFYIPLILVLPKMLGLQGVFVTQPLADFMTLLVSLAFFIPTRKELNQAIHSLV